MAQEIISTISQGAETYAQTLRDQGAEGDIAIKLIVSNETWELMTGKTPAPSVGSILTKTNSRFPHRYPVNN